MLFITKSALHRFCLHAQGCIVRQSDKTIYSYGPPIGLGLSVAKCVAFGDEDRITQGVQFNHDL